MNLHGLMHGVTGEPPGAYANSYLPDREHPVSSKESVLDSATNENSAYRIGREDSVTLTTPEAIRNDSDSNRVATCYCGHCSACSMHAQAKSADQMNARTDYDQKRTEDPDDEEKAPNELSEAEKQQVEKLQRRDQEVRAHEQAHAAAGATNVRYEYQVGPDGRPYAVGGSADFQSMSMGNDHDSRISEARRMRTAALAPGDPSPQDMAVAAKATRLESEAIADKAEEQREELSEEAEENTVANPNEPFNVWA